MRAEDVMIATLAAVAEGATLREAATRMRNDGTDVLAVLRGGRVVGTLSQRDLMLGCCADGCDPSTTHVHEVMTARIGVCDPEADLSAALGQMTEQKVDALVVRTSSGHSVGLLTRLRVLEGLAYPDDKPHGPVPEEVKQVRGDAP